MTTTSSPKHSMVVEETSTAGRNGPGATTTTTADTRWSRLDSPTTVTADAATTIAHVETAAMTRHATNGGSGDLANLATTTEHLAQSTIS